MLYIVTSASSTTSMTIVTKTSACPRCARRAHPLPFTTCLPIARYRVLLLLVERVVRVVVAESLVHVGLRPGIGGGVLRSFDVVFGVLARKLGRDAGRLVTQRLAEVAIYADRRDRDEGHDDDVLGHALARLPATQNTEFAERFDVPHDCLRLAYLI